MADKDKYGIPKGGNPGPGYVAKKWKGLSWQLSWEEMIAAVYLGGWPKNYWGTAAAVAAAESSRNPFIYNTLKRGHFGLFQISRSAHPEFFTPNGEGMQWVSPVASAQKGYEIYKDEGWGAWQAKTSGAYLAFYPSAMEAAANFERKMGLHGGDEKAWAQSLFRKGTTDRILGAYVAGIPEKDIKANQGLLGKQLLSGIVAGAKGVAEGVTASGDAVASTVNSEWGWLPDLWSALTTPALWMRLGYGVLGIGLIGGGLFLIVRNQPAVQKTAQTVASVVPGGAALKAAKGA
jgi:hypothetical protein